MSRHGPAGSRLSGRSKLSADDRDARLPCRVTFELGIGGVDEPGAQGAAFGDIRVTG